MNPITKPFRFVACLALGLFQALAGCAESRDYIWVHDLPEAQTADEYVILSGDLLSVKVFGQENMSTHARVRTDGKIALPFLGDVEVMGRPPTVVSNELAVRLKEFMVSPVVTITVEESLPASVSVLGEVTRPGVYTVEASTGVLQALALAGGFTDYANRGSIYLIRPTSARRPTSTRRIRFAYASLAHGRGRSLAYRLRAGDVLVVE